MEDSILFTDEFIEMLNLETPNHGEIRWRIIRAFNAATGSNLEETISSNDDGLLCVVQWLNRLLMSDDPQAHFFTKKPVLLSVFSPDLSSKINALSQFNCPFCKGNAPVVIVPIRIRPVTHQASDSKTKNAFKKAINSRLSNVHNFTDRHLCVHITFVIGRKGYRKDADNMAKLLLDGMEKIIFVNDNQIDHLSLLKLRWEGEEEWIVVRIMDTNINQHDDVLYHKLRHSWAGAEELLLEDFMDA